MYKILVTSRTFGTVTPDCDYFLERGWEIKENPYAGGVPTEDQLCDLIRDVDAIIPGNDRISKRVLDCANRLKVIGRPGIGYDNIDVAECSRRGIAVTNAPGINSVAVAELAMALMLNVSKLVMYTNRRVMKGMWPADQGHDLCGKKLGILGFGRIGQHVAKRAKAFDMDVWAYDPITGPDVDQETIRAYVRRALDRACRLGVRRVVVGSSGARNVPEGFDRSRAWDQLREFLRLAGGEAAERNVLLAIEPINHGESNIINTTGEGRRLMEAADSPCTGMLVDYFHYVVEKDTPGEIWQLKGKLWHAHISQPKGRVLPTRQEAEEYREFFRALKKSAMRTA